MICQKKYTVENRGENFQGHLASLINVILRNNYMYILSTVFFPFFKESLSQTIAHIHTHFSPLFQYAFLYSDRYNGLKVIFTFSRQAGKTNVLSL